MAYGQLFPHYIECGLLVGYRCEGCGRAGRRIEIRYPAIAQREGNSVEIVYPVRCSCGRSGHWTIKMPALLLGYLLARVELLNARGRARRTPKDVKPQRSELLDNFIRDFEKAILAHGSVHSVVEGVAPRGRDENRDDPPASPTELDRLRFGFDEQTWLEFLRRIGHDNERDPKEE